MWGTGLFFRTGHWQIANNCKVHSATYCTRLCNSMSITLALKKCWEVATSLAIAPVQTQAIGEDHLGCNWWLVCISSFLNRTLSLSAIDIYVHFYLHIHRSIHTFADSFTHTHTNLITHTRIANQLYKSPHTHKHIHTPNIAKILAP